VIHARFDAQVLRVVWSCQCWTAASLAPPGACQLCVLSLAQLGGGTRSACPVPDLEQAAAITLHVVVHRGLFAFREVCKCLQVYYMSTAELKHGIEPQEYCTALYRAQSALLRRARSVGGGMLPRFFLPQQCALQAWPGRQVNLI
jgi:hypothetical protein